jgi:hypothetical protein
MAYKEYAENCAKSIDLIGERLENSTLTFSLYEDPLSKKWVARFSDDSESYVEESDKSIHKAIAEVARSLDLGGLNG